MSAKRKSISSDLKRLDKITDANIDYSDIPPLDESFFKKEIVTLPQKKDSITLRIDHDVLELNKPLSTYERKMKNQKFRKAYEQRYKELLFSELLIS